MMQSARTADNNPPVRSISEKDRGEIGTLFDDSGFWAKEKVLEAECEGDEYDRPEKEEDYPLHASNRDPVVTTARNTTRKRRDRIKRRQNVRKKTEIK